MATLLTIPKNSREAYALTVKEVGAKKLSKELSVSLQHIYRMGASRKTNGEVRDNPFIQSQKTLRTMLKKGLHDAAFIVADSFARMIGGEIAFRDHTPDKDTYQEEMLDTAKATADLMEICQLYLEGKANFGQMRTVKKAAHNEIDQLVQKAVETRRTQQN